jgi:hypothetical protein
MKKHKVLDNIRAARLAHVKWVDRARRLVDGGDITEHEIPVEATTCDFGHWFYSDGQVLLALFSVSSVKKLELKHKELHSTYMKIFKIYFDTTNQSFFEKFFNKRKKVSEKEKVLANEELKHLELISDDLISYLNIFEKHLNLIEDKDFEKLY